MEVESMQLFDTSMTVADEDLSYSNCLFLSGPVD